MTDIEKMVKSCQQQQFKRVHFYNFLYGTGNKLALQVILITIAAFQKRHAHIKGPQTGFGKHI
jgi:hypothetical protein